MREKEIEFSAAGGVTTCVQGVGESRERHEGLLAGDGPERAMTGAGYG